MNEWTNGEETHRVIDKSVAFKKQMFKLIFYLGGSDGFVNIWDPFNKKRLCQFHRYPTDVSSLAFSHDGNMIAIGVSPVLPEEGQEKAHKDAVIIRHVSDSETQPK